MAGITLFSLVVAFSVAWLVVVRPAQDAPEKISAQQLVDGRAGADAKVDGSATVGSAMPRTSVERLDASGVLDLELRVEDDPVVELVAGVEHEALEVEAVTAVAGNVDAVRATRNVQDVSDAARGVCSAEADRLDAELSNLRYIAWAIPAIGFIGTVRGIGDALGEAHKAVTGDVSGVTEGLGTAFNSTLAALLISIVLMFLLHQLQLAQERLVLDAETYLDRNLIRHMQLR